MIELKPINQCTKLKKGDLLLISDGRKVKAYTIKDVLLDLDGKGAEVILNKKKNTYFNLRLYFGRTSWARDVRVVRLTQ